MKDIKILVACHKEAHIPNNSMLLPIEVGASNSKKSLNYDLKDNLGENISDKNKAYCEVTALYWAWKNLDADYYGLCHYRRYFIFDKLPYQSNTFGDVVVDSIHDKNYLKVLEDEVKTRKFIEEYDLIVPELGSFEDQTLTMMEQYRIAREHKESDLKVCLDIIKEKYPDMHDFALKYLNQTKGLFCNMFVMKKELFNDYCAWLFDILFEHEKRVNYEDYDVSSYRVSGYLAERMTGIYLSWMIEKMKVKYKSVQRTLFLNTDAVKQIKPAFKEKNNAIILAADDFYVPYVSTMLESIFDNSNAEENYDIIIFTRNIHKKNQLILIEQTARYRNIKLRFFDVSEWMRDYGNVPLRGHFRIETYFRILAPEILPAYDKVLYLDSDMIVQSDLSELFNVNIDGYLIGACKDPDTAGLYNGGFNEPHKKEYIDNVLKMKNPYNYFQAGVILMNLKEFRKEYTVTQMMEFAMSYQWELLDQDVLNALAMDSVKYVDMAWNVMVDWKDLRINEIIKWAPISLYEEYMKARKEPKIIHYAGPDKPWEIPYSDFAEVFWKYARQTPYYEVLLMRLNYREIERAIGSINREYVPQIPYSEPIPERKSLVRKTADVLLPIGSKRREFVKKILKRH